MPHSRAAYPATEGKRPAIKLNSGPFDTLLSTYLQQAEDTPRFYAADAAINGLFYSRHKEEKAVATFARSI